MKKIAPILIFLAVAMTGCLKDYGQPYGNCNRLNYIQLNIGDQTEVVTRAGETNNEYHIANAYLLIFNAAGQYKTGEKVETITEGNSTKMPKLTTAMIIENGDKVMVLCNVESTANDTALSSLTSLNCSIANINTKFSFPAYNSYNQAGDDSGKGLPMSGVMTWNNADSQKQCVVYRSVAKVELDLSKIIDSTDDVTGKFIGANKNNVRWGMENFTTNGNIYSEADVEGVKTSFPSGTGNTLEYPAVGTFQAAYPAGTSEKVTALYIPDHKNSIIARGTAAAVSDVTFNAGRACLIVRTGAISTDFRYYRIDLFDKTKFIDIERKYRYKVTITKVLSDGYISQAAALANPGSNLEYKIEAIADEYTAITLSNGQYALMVSHDEVHIHDTKDATTQHDLIKVGYKLGASGVAPGAISVESTEFAVALSPITGSSENGQLVKATLKSAYVTAGVGTVTVRLGNLVKEVKVKVYGQLPAAPTGDIGTMTASYLLTAPSLGESVLEKDNELSITDNGSSYTLHYKLNKKAVVRRFHINVSKQRSDGTTGIVKIAGKQAPGTGL